MKRDDDVTKPSERGLRYACTTQMARPRKGNARKPHEMPGNSITNSLSCERTKGGNRLSLALKTGNDGFLPVLIPQQLINARDHVFSYISQLLTESIAKDLTEKDFFSLSENTKIEISCTKSVRETDKE